PPDQALDLALQGPPRGVPGVRQLLILGDGIDVRRVNAGRAVNSRRPGPAEERVEQEPGSLRSLDAQDSLEGLQPLRRLLGVNVRDLRGEGRPPDDVFGADDHRANAPRALWVGGFTPAETGRTGARKSGA